jgi:hypothetical protein
MSLRKPFRAAPVRLGPHAAARRRKAGGAQAAQLIAFALLCGLAIGMALAFEPRAGTHYVRQHAPPAGAYYPGCNAARAAGVAPILEGEPGYRPELDGDSDGIACEPHRQGF